MPLTKKYSRDRSTCRVGFTMPLEATGQARRLFLAGDFNGWDPRALPMRKAGGVFRVSLDLPAGTAQQYRYVSDQGVWLNDTEADCTVYNDFAQAENSVAVL